jgi:acyl-CoA synthetase (AMP-forming)/AMP-acid ligase II
MARLAGAWRTALAETGPAPRAPVALVMASHPEAIALLFALAAGPAPIILLPAELRGWQCEPPLPPGARIVLPPALADRAAEAGRLGAPVEVLPRPPAPPPRGASRPGRAPGLVVFTSGSTGRPRPVYRTWAQGVAAARLLARVARGRARAGVIGSLPLDRTFGLHHTVMLAAVTRRPLALLERFEPRQVLDLFASGAYRYWAGTPVMADVLARCRLPRSSPAPHPAPPFCVISGRVPAPVARAFRARFGISLRQVYGTSETGPVTLDAAPAARVRSEAAGRPLPGVRVRIGDDPRRPLPPGRPGRVWVAGHGCARGYGFPPAIEPLPGVDGWWASPDAGRLDRDGTLVLAGRLDDGLRTAAGHLILPAAVAEALEAHPGVAEAVVVPLGLPGQPVLAALLESTRPLDLDAVRGHLARSLPAWSRPRVLQQTLALPRLPGGKADRLACIARLARAAAADPG